MNQFAILLAFVAVVSTLKQELFVLPKELIDKVYKFASPCVEKYNIDPGVIKEIVNAAIPRDEATNNFLYCFGLSGGYIVEDGHIVIERLVGIIGNHPLSKEYEQALKKCNEITKENPIATTVAMNDCIADTAPIRFMF